MSSAAEDAERRRVQSVEDATAEVETQKELLAEKDKVYIYIYIFVTR